MGGACSTYGREDRCIKGFAGGHDEKRQLERPRRRCEGNIKWNDKWDGKA
jgi:hypothetical protein